MERILTVGLYMVLEIMEKGPEREADYRSTGLFFDPSLPYPMRLTILVLQTYSHGSMN